MTPNHTRNAKAKRQSSRGRTTQHSRWQVAKNVYGVVFLVVLIYVGINLLRG
jgi:hypothetical protein